MNGEQVKAKFSKLGSTGLLIGVLAAIVCGIFAFSATEIFFKAYIYGWLMSACLAIGFLSLLMLIHTVRASWGRPIIRMLEAGSSPKAFVIILILFAPILFSVWTNIGSPYPWTDAARVAADPILQHKEPWMNPAFFTIRILIYFAVFIFFSAILTKWSHQEDETGDLAFTSKRTNWSSGGLVAIVLTVTLFFTDVSMSMDAHWFSSIYGPWFLVSSALAALSLCVMLFMSLVHVEPYRSIVTPKLTRDLGNLMLAITLLWAYFTLSQFIIIWSGNLPEFITYYWVRSQDGWQWLGALVILFGFFVPFFGLLSPRSKRVPALLGSWATLILTVRFFDVYLAVSPAAMPEPLLSNWQFFGIQVLGVAALVGIWLWCLGSGMASTKRFIVSYYKKDELHHPVPFGNRRPEVTDHV